MREQVKANVGCDLSVATCRRGDRITKLCYGPICGKLFTNVEEIATDEHRFQNVMLYQFAALVGLN